MPGWESLIRITRADSWSIPGTLGRRGFFLYADSENLDMGAQPAERDNKLLGVRESSSDTFSIDRYFPRGDFTFQPRVDDILMILMAHFQNVVKSGTGTYEFYRLDRLPKFVSGGSNIGTHVYSVNVDLYFGASFTTVGGTQANGIRFTNGMVDRLTFGLRYGEDLICTPSFKFDTGSYYGYPAAFGYNSVYGSMSEISRFVDYMGTATIQGESFDIENWEGVFNNNTTDRSRLGKRGYNRFPFVGKWVAEGSFDMELQRDLERLAEGNTDNFTVDILNSANNRIVIAQPNIAHRPFTIPISGGDAIIELSKSYRAYPPVGTNAPSTIVRVYTGTTLGTDLLGF